MKIHLHVKIRAFGRDISTIDNTFPLPTEVALALSVAQIKPSTWFNDHGVTIALVA